MEWSPLPSDHEESINGFRRVPRSSSVSSRFLLPAVLPTAAAAPPRLAAAAIVRRVWWPRTDTRLIDSVGATWTPPRLSLHAT